MSFHLGLVYIRGLHGAGISDPSPHIPAHCKSVSTQSRTHSNPPRPVPRQFLSISTRPADLFVTCQDTWDHKSTQESILCCSTFHQFLTCRLWRASENSFCLAFIYYPFCLLLLIRFWYICVMNSDDSDSWIIVRLYLCNVTSGDTRPPCTADRIEVVTDRISLMTSIYDTEEHCHKSSFCHIIQTVITIISGPDHTIFPSPTAWTTVTSYLD